MQERRSSPTTYPDRRDVLPDFVAMRNCKSPKPSEPFFRSVNPLSLIDIEIAMRAQMPNQAVPFSLRATEIDQQQPAVRLEDTRHFPDAEMTRTIRKAVEDRRAQHDVECRLGERQRLGASQLEVDFGASSCRLFARASDHLSRCVQPEHSARRADSTLGSDGERPRSAADIQHRFVSPYSGLFERLRSDPRQIMLSRRSYAKAHRNTRPLGCA